MNLNLFYAHGHHKCLRVQRERTEIEKDKERHRGRILDTNIRL